MNSSMTQAAGSAASNLPSSVTFFPDLSMFEEDEEDVEREETPILSDWALKKIGTLQARLEGLQADRGSRRFFGKSFQLANFSSHIIINLANDTFGYDGWSSEILECTLVDESIAEHGEEEEEKKPVYSAFFLAKVRVTLRDGTYCDGMGRGEASNMPHKYMCFSKSKKQAITDGVKHAITGFSEKLLDYELACIEKDSTSDTLAILQMLNTKN